MAYVLLRQCVMRPTIVKAPLKNPKLLTGLAALAERLSVDEGYVNPDERRNRIEHPIDIRPPLPASRHFVSLPHRVYRNVDRSVSVLPASGRSITRTS